MDLDGIHIFTREEMDRLVRMLNMPPSDRYITFSEAEMNRLSACCRAFDEYEREILALTGASLAEVLLSKYYWRGRLETQGPLGAAGREVPGRQRGFCPVHLQSVGGVRQPAGGYRLVPGGAAGRGD